MNGVRYSALRSRGSCRVTRPRTMHRILAAFFALLFLAPALHAQTDGELRRVVLIDGTVIVGTVVDESADPVVVVTEAGVEQRVPRAQVELVAPLIEGRFFRIDPTRTRLVLTPTGRTLGAGRTRVGTLLYICLLYTSPSPRDS